MISMTREQVSAKVYAIVSDTLEISNHRISKESRYIDDLGADSLSTCKIIASLEEAFAEEIDYRDAEKLTSVGKTIEYIMTHMVADPCPTSAA